MASLFGRNALKARAEAITTDEVRDRIAILESWLQDYETGTLKTDTETSRQGQYIEDIFGKVLGYRLKPASPYTFEPQVKTSNNDFPDGVMRYNDSEIVSAVVELKGASANLDRPQRGPAYGNLSPVQQAFKYKPAYSVCPFVIVSNFYEFRLYNDNQLDYEVWTLRDLVDPTDDYLAFKQWYFLLQADNFVVQNGKSPTELFLSDIRQEQLEIGKEFYAEYREIRLDLLRDIWRRNREWHTNFHDAIRMAQTVIDRFVFVCFAEDGGLLPDHTLTRIVDYAESSPHQTMWEAFKAFFHSIAHGSRKLGIPEGYGGALFADDPILNSLEIGDAPLRALASIGGKYDFQDDLRVNILGHVFEQSITDLEDIKRQIDLDLDPLGIEPEKPKSGKRKKEGIFYTPDYIVRYIVEHTVGAYLAEREDEIRRKHNLTRQRTDEGYEAKEYRAYSEYQQVVQSIKVIDPACGSGAFLVNVFDYLLEENRRVANILSDGSLLSTDDYVRRILTTNIFGVDLNEESVEITKLSLWLKTASKGKELAELGANIKSGNSLISDSNVTDRAFDWSRAFPEAVGKGGFHVVVGNPPYVNAIEMNKFMPEIERKALKKGYATSKGAVDLYIYFFERGMNLLRPGGKLGYITPNRYVSVGYGAALRKWLVDGYVFDSILNCSDSRVFEDAATYPVITILKNEKPTEHYKVRAGRLEEERPSGEWVLHDSEKLSSLPEYIIGFLLNDKLPIAEKVFAKSGLLAEAGTIKATSTAGEADDYADYISDDHGHKIINTGTIDPYLPLWGKETFTKKGKRYLRPRLDLTQVSDGRRRLYKDEKIILAKLALRAEAVYDRAGEYASIDTNCIHSFDDDFSPEYVLCWLNSRLYNYVFECLFDGARMSGGYMGYSAPAMRCTPIKKLPPEDEKQFLDIAKELENLYSAKYDADRKFRSIVTMAAGLKSWPGTNANWWELEVENFIANFKKRFKTSQIEDLMDAHGKHAPEVQTTARRIKTLTHRADLRFYDLFDLTRTERARVEAMNFTI
ncbi:Eco57I restriction-modification methylase domain-containing protein [Dietzia maris]|uniref:Eco57I restriction-modification methylase domain-containing protein n=1 Tax=Dietzia maris TaxID=37915 RepID=UPI0037C8C127